MSGSGEVVPMAEVVRLVEQATGRRVTSLQQGVALSIARTHKLLVIRLDAADFLKLQQGQTFTWEINP